jgi:hypothetical protein
MKHLTDHPFHTGTRIQSYTDHTVLYLKRLRVEYNSTLVRCNMEKLHANMVVDQVQSWSMHARTPS